MTKPAEEWEPKNKKGRKFTHNEHGYCGPEDLTFASWNPKSRIDATNKAFIKLCDSIREWGQISPVIISIFGLVIDGNRRVAACAVLHKDVEFLVRGSVNAFQLYREVNHVRAPLKGKDLLEIYMTEPRVLAEATLLRFRRLEKNLGGSSNLELLMKLSPKTSEYYLGTCKSIRSRLLRNRRTLSKAIPSFFEIAKWGLSHDCAGRAYDWCRYGGDLGYLLDLITTNKPIEVFSIIKQLKRADK